ncbi:MAG TPA: error-prone DNA polymerase, partial [Rhabdaerophilum sp.]|nr:error-prone DNA polymerase [Rhabdaerophilum sp.]
MKSPVPPYAELACATNFSFLRGASPAVDLVFASLLLGYRGLGIADRNTLAGVVRAWSALRDLREGGILPPIRLREGSGPGEFRFETRTIPSAPEQPTPDEAGENALRTLLKARAENFRLATGARLAFEDGTPDIVAYPADRHGWSALCRLLTEGNRRAPKGACALAIEDLLRHARHLLLVVMPGRERGALPALLARLQEAAPEAVWLGATMPRRGDDRRRLAELMAIGKTA